jgi:hypothetical protein
VRTTGARGRDLLHRRAPRWGSEFYPNLEFKQSKTGFEPYVFRRKLGSGDSGEAWDPACGPQKGFSVPSHAIALPAFFARPMPTWASTVPDARVLKYALVSPLRKPT